MGQPDEEKKKGLGASFAAHLHPLLALMLASVLLCMHQFHKNKAVSPKQEEKGAGGETDVLHVQTQCQRAHTCIQ